MWFPTQNYMGTHVQNVVRFGQTILIPSFEPQAVQPIVIPAAPAPVEAVQLLQKEKIVAHVSPTRFPFRAFHNYSENGDDSMYFLRPTFNQDDRIPLMERMMRFDEDGTPEAYFLYEGHDFRRLYLNFNRTGSIKGLVIRDDLSTEAESILLRYSLVGRHMKKVWSRGECDTGKMLARSFPKEFISNQNAL